MRIANWCPSVAFVLPRCAFPLTSFLQKLHSRRAQTGERPTHASYTARLNEVYVVDA